MNQLALHNQPVGLSGVLSSSTGITSPDTTPLTVMNSHNATNKQPNKGNNMNNDMDTVVLTTQGEQSAKIDGMDYEIIPVDIDFKAMIWGTRCNSLLGKQAYNKILTIAENSMASVDRAPTGDIHELALFVDALYQIALRHENQLVQDIGIDKVMCIICELPIEADPDGWNGGHNAEPVEAGECCGKCNDTVVTPARMESLPVR